MRFFVLSFVLISSCSNNSEISNFDPMNLDLIKNDKVNSVAVYTLSYSATASACGDIYNSNLLKDRLIKLLSIAKKKKSITNDGLKILKSPVYYVTKGANLYKYKSFVSCSEARNYYDGVKKQVDSFIITNS